MQHQLTGLMEAFVADRTLIGPLAGVDPGVVFQVTELQEAFVADRTLIGPLAGVGSECGFFRLTDFREAFVADRTLIGPLAGVGLGVVFSGKMDCMKLLSQTVHL